MSDISFYQNHLNRVSRSFAFCIEQLEGPFREWVSLSYLLCRLLDTVEDSAWESPTEQQEHFIEFGRFLLAPPAASEIRSWIDSFKGKASADEMLLVEDSPILWEALHALSPEVKRAIQDSVGYMNEGMIRFQQSRTNGVLRLAGLAEVNEYCYVVAGVVGEMLTRLYAAYKPSFNPDGIVLKNACRFGLFLQKVNLLKDQSRDEAEGRFFIADRHEVVSSLTEEARSALNYLLSLPKEETGYRTFCAWSLFLGLASLAAPGGRVPRSFAEPMLNQVREAVSDNQQLEKYFEIGASRIDPTNALGSANFGLGL